MQGSVCPRQGRSAALSGALVASSIREDQHIGGVLTHSWLPYEMKEESIALMGKSRVSCSTDISNVSNI